MKYFILIITAILFINCEKKALNDCSEIICTREFRIIMVNIVDKNLEPVILTSYKVIDLDNKNDVTPYREFYGEQGYYPVVTDGSIEVHHTREMEFVGYIDGVEVITSNYVAEQDCCHVSLVSGNLTLTLQ